MKKIILFLFIIFIFYKMVINNYIISKSTKSIVKKIKNNSLIVKKTFIFPPKISIKKQVEINNQSKLSPKIIEFGDNYIIVEKLDYTFRDMFFYNKLNKSKIQKIINLFRKLDQYKYSHNDLNWRNIMWSNKLNDFQVIDWEYATIRKKKVKNIKNNLDYLKFKIDEIAFPLKKKERELGFNILKNIYLKKNPFNYITSFYKFWKY